MKKPNAEILESIKYSLLDLSDAGFYIAQSVDGPLYKISITNPASIELVSSFNFAEIPHRLKNVISDGMGVCSYLGFKTYFDKMEQTLKFILSYIPDMHSGVNINCLAISFIDTQFNCTVSKDDFIYPRGIDRIIPDIKISDVWLDILTDKARPGFYESDISSISIVFEVSTAQKFLDKFVPNKLESESWIKKIIKKIYDIFK